MVGESLHSAFFLAFPCVDWSRAVLSCELKRRLERVELLAVSLSKQMLGEMSINEFQVNIGKNLSRMLYKYYTFMLFYFTISFFDFLELIFLLCQWIVTITLSSSFRGILDWGLRELPFDYFFHLHNQNILQEFVEFGKSRKCRTAPSTRMFTLHIEFII